MSTNRLDMEPVLTLLKAAYNLASQIDRKEWDDTGANNTEKAELSRSINHLADQLQIASAMVKNEYWIGKGFKDSISTVTDGEEQ